MEQNITIQKLKQQRATPAEKFVLGKVKGAKANEPYKNGNVDWFNKDGIWLFGQDFKNNILWIRHSGIWLVLEKQHGLNHSEIQQLIQNVMYKYTNNGQLTPILI